jgi:hypothetical protein
LVSNVPPAAPRVVATVTLGTPVARIVPPFQSKDPAPPPVVIVPVWRVPPVESASEAVRPVVARTTWPALTVPPPIESEPLAAAPMSRVSKTSSVPPVMLDEPSRVARRAKALPEAWVTPPVAIAVSASVGSVPPQVAAVVHAPPAVVLVVPLAPSSFRYSSSRA